MTNETTADTRSPLPIDLASRCCDAIRRLDLEVANRKRFANLGNRVAAAIRIPTLFHGAAAMQVGLDLQARAAAEAPVSKRRCR